jgi:phosphatidylserine/phosphatidylglycerophosphate/cardiolipin synthase-like enzyme
METTTIGSVAVPKFEWDQLHLFKAEKRFLDGYPPDTRTFYAPRDDVHSLLVSLLESTQNSLVLNMFGYTDERLDEIIRKKLADEQVYVQMSLDSKQASGEATKKILERWNNDGFGNSIAIGTSAKHAISHLKVLIVDGVYTVSGSTNWSPSG